MANLSPVLWCFAFYVLVLLLFAIAYYLLYRHQQSFFYFGADLADSQRKTLQSGSERLIRGLETVREALPGMANGLKTGSTLVSLAEESQKTTFYNGCSFRLRKALSVTPASTHQRISNPKELICIEVLDLDGSEILTEPLAEVQLHPGEDEEAIKDYLNKIPRRIAEARRRLSVLRSPDARIWSFWDFLYFSVVCQTTVGFGDILPNATAVRLLVVFQILLGYAILVVVLNIILTH
jgi:hypothetical protein